MGQIASLKMTDALLKMNNLQAKKQFGQNFIINSSVVEDIVNGSGIDNKTLVIEIGAGLGALTEELVRKAGEVIAYEIDNDLIPILRQQLFVPNLHIVNKDFLDVDLMDVSKKYPNYKIVVISNLPYYVTSEILIKLFVSEVKIQKVIAMMQKEVGMKLTKEIDDKEENELTLLTRFANDIKVLKHVSKNDFLPRPHVDSVVLEFKRKETQVRPVDYLNTIKILFAQRRKTLLNNLADYYNNKLKAEGILKQCNIDPSTRAETLTVEQILLIHNEMEKLKYDL